MECGGESTSQNSLVENGKMPIRVVWLFRYGIRQVWSYDPRCTSFSSVPQYLRGSRYARASSPRTAEIVKKEKYCENDYTA
jgi:hypothetical protein